MKCKSKECNNESLERFSYCNKHLCDKCKRDGERCKNKKFKGKKYCFVHAKYIGDKIGLWGLVTGILAIIIAIITIFFGNNIYSLVWGRLYIDFKENPEDIFYIGEEPYIKIEVLNELGYPLLNINGTVTIRCMDMRNQITSKTFKLPENKEFLPHNKVDFLIAHDQLFIDVINTKKDSCSDATYITGKYKKINQTHAQLMEINIYGFFNDQEPIKKNCGVTDTIETNTCLYCNITTEIYASKNKKFSGIETHKFVGFTTQINPFKDVIASGSMGDSFYLSGFGRFKSFKLCEGLSEIECDELVCNELNSKFGADIACKESKDVGSWSFPAFTKGEFNPPDSCE